MYIGQTPVYQNDSVNDTKATQLPPIPGDLDEMPAVIMARGLMGDANLDGKVDINDLTIVLAHYGQTGMTWSHGRVHRRRHGGYQRLDHRAGELQPDRRCVRSRGHGRRSRAGRFSPPGAALIGLASAYVARKQGRG